MVMGHHQPVGSMILSGAHQEELGRAAGQAEPGETPWTSISSGLRENIQMQVNDLGVPDLQDTPQLDSLLGAAPWRGSVSPGGKHWVL